MGIFLTPTISATLQTPAGCLTIQFPQVKGLSPIRWPPLQNSKKNFMFNIFERDREQAGEGQRERETQNPKQAPGSELSAQSLTWGLNS